MNTFRKIISILIVILSLVVTSSSKITNTQLKISPKTALASTNTCKVIIINTHELLDLKTTCNPNTISTPNYLSILNLINFKASYLLID